jgi:hypothetical protein
MYEVAHKKRVLVLKALSRFDDKAEAKMIEVRSLYEKEKNQLKTFVRVDLPRYAMDATVVVQKKIKEKYHSVFLNTRGVRVLRTDRDASDFLRNISEDRERDGKGRIEE